MSPSESAPRSGEPLTLADVADLVGGRCVGEASLRVEGVASLEEAGPAQMGFLAIKRYARRVPGSSAGAFLVSSELEVHLAPEAARVVVDDPYPALRTLLRHFVPEKAEPARVHPTAILGAGVELAEGVRIEPYAVVEAGASIAAGTRVGAHCVIGADAEVGPDCTLHPHVVLYPGTSVGAGVIIHSGARVGSDGFGYTSVDGVPLKMPQVGRAVVGDGVEIGANTTVDRGSLGDTVLGDHVKLDNLVQVAHNVRIGAGTLMAALVGIAGSTRIGRGAWLGGRASAINHLEIGDGAQVAFGSTVMRDVPPGQTVSGSPARPHREELHRQAHVGRLPSLLKRIERLEASAEAAD